MAVATPVSVVMFLLVLASFGALTIAYLKLGFLGSERRSELPFGKAAALQIHRCLGEP